MEASKTFTYPKKFKSYLKKKYTFDIDKNGYNSYVRMLPFYLVRTSPQLVRTGGVEGIRMHRYKAVAEDVAEGFSFFVDDSTTIDVDNFDDVFV
jgi:hypothetical protein